MPLRNVRPKETQAVIANAGTTSTQVNLRDGSFSYSAGNIVVPDLTGAATFKYQVTADGTTFVDLKTTAGVAFAATIPENQTIPLPTEIFSFLAFRVVASGAMGAEMVFVVRLT